jgi:hypothetical protein
MGFGIFAPVIALIQVANYYLMFTIIFSLSNTVLFYIVDMIDSGRNIKKEYKKMKSEGWALFFFILLMGFSANVVYLIVHIFEKITGLDFFSCLER